MLGCWGLAIRIVELQPVLLCTWILYWSFGNIITRLSLIQASYRLCLKRIWFLPHTVCFGEEYISNYFRRITYLPVLPPQDILNHNLWSQLTTNSLWPSAVMCWHRSGSTFVQVMAGCLTAPSHCLNQCWRIIRRVQWRSCEGNFTSITLAINC